MLLTVLVMRADECQVCIVNTLVSIPQAAPEDHKPQRHDRPSPCAAGGWLGSGSDPGCHLEVPRSIPLACILLSQPGIQDHPHSTMSIGFL